MNRKIIIQIPFNVQNFNRENELNEEWITYRLDIFLKYCLKSLINQTNQYFHTLLRVRNETFPFIQGKLSGELPDNVIIVSEPSEEYFNTIKKLTQDYDEFLEVRLDSDDCFVNYYVDLLHNTVISKDTEVLISQNHCCYDIVQQRLAKLFRLSPPGYALAYKTGDYYQGKRYYLKRGHGGAILLKHQLLEGYTYLNNIHRKNNQSYFPTEDKAGWENVKEITGIEKTNILHSFGIEE